ncbi:hypothetical protein J5X84_19935 [Streptosporangiaceae bacterium NEAU-GS5]|nr:hypothetical protein [Streptosporangiaceae bacterium NEAU-GS5]
MAPTVGETQAAKPADSAATMDHTSAEQSSRGVHCRSSEVDVPYQGRDLDMDCVNHEYSGEELVNEAGKGLIGDHPERTVNPIWRRANGDKTPTYDYCRRQLDGGTTPPDDFMATKPGDALCLLTNMGRVAYVRVIRVTDNATWVSFIVWRSDQDPA